MDAYEGAQEGGMLKVLLGEKNREAEVCIPADLSALRQVDGKNRPLAGF